MASPSPQPQQAVNRAHANTQLQPPREQGSTETWQTASGTCLPPASPCAPGEIFLCLTEPIPLFLCLDLIKKILSTGFRTWNPGNLLKLQIKGTLICIYFSVYSERFRNGFTWLTKPNTKCRRKKAVFFLSVLSLKGKASKTKTYTSI